MSHDDFTSSRNLTKICLSVAVQATHATQDSELIFLSFVNRLTCAIIIIV